MTERTEQTEQKKQSGLRVAWSTRYLDPDTGRECELQISNGDSRTVLAKSKDVLAWLDQIGAPAGGERTGGQHGAGDGGGANDGTGRRTGAVVDHQGEARCTRPGGFVPAR